VPQQKQVETRTQSWRKFAPDGHVEQGAGTQQGEQAAAAKPEPIVWDQERWQTPVFEAPAHARSATEPAQRAARLERRPAPSAHKNPIATRAAEWEQLQVGLDYLYDQPGPLVGRRRTSLPALIMQGWWPLGIHPAVVTVALVSIAILAWHLLVGGAGESSISRFFNSVSTGIALSGPQITLGGQAQLLGPGEGAASAFLPLPGDGPFRLNVVAALEANGGALQNVVIPPGGSWSFNRSVGNPGVLTLTTIAGVYGGGWCDLASRYVMALRPLLPAEQINFVRHRDATGIGLAGVADADAVAIWNTNNRGGEQDLLVRNPTRQTLILSASLVEGGVEVRAAFR
jgi:hypothetical protein